MKNLEARVRKIEKQFPQQAEKNGEIETAYNGQTFKSRLEARWAVFFDTLGVPYERGKELRSGYELNGNPGEVCIIPSFLLPKQKCWIEIKQQEPNQEELDKARLLSNSTFMDVIMFYGAIRLPSFDRFLANSKSRERVWYFTSIPVGDRYETPYTDGLHAWAQCPWCLQVGITCAGHVRQIKCECCKYIDPFMELNQPLKRLIDLSPEIASREPERLNTRYPNRPPYYRLQISEWWSEKCSRLEYGGDSPRLIQAYKAAIEARFDYEMALAKK